jgi:hypothetical protein
MRSRYCVLLPALASGESSSKMSVAIGVIDGR